MSMTPASSKYFEQVAGQWDEIRSGYFTEAVREAAIRKAYLRPEMVVADVGAGTGFMTAGLAPLVKRVYVLDGSPSMLEVAQKNLAGFGNLVFQKSDGLSLPLPEESLDVVFANMYLHHAPDPLEAIREMVRLLRPGGRLVITDMDSHGNTWFKKEMADVWLGFERAQVKAWFREAGLVNVIVDCSGESCYAESKDEAIAKEGQAHVSVFVAVGTRRVPGVQESVQAGYGAIAEGKSSCCSEASLVTGTPEESSCCASSNLITFEEVTFTPFYTPDERAQIPSEAAELSLGCGNPTALAELKEGEIVLDIGSGGGIDAFLAAKKVGPTGKVIGVDMTPAMLDRARRSAQKAGYTWVEFRQGQAEALPVESGTVDVVISNCVINLCEDKGMVFDEVYRVLKPGGRLEVSDVVTDGPFPLEALENPANWPGCVFGALPEAEYLDLVRQAGFEEIKVRKSLGEEVGKGGKGSAVRVYSAMVEGRKR